MPERKNPIAQLFADRKSGRDILRRQRGYEEITEGNHSLSYPQDEIHQFLENTMASIEPVSFIGAALGLTITTCIDTLDPTRVIDFNQLNSDASINGLKTIGLGIMVGIIGGHAIEEIRSVAVGRRERRLQQKMDD